MVHPEKLTESVKEVPSLSPQATVDPGVLRAAIKEAKQDPETIAELFVTMYAKGYRAGLSDGLKLEERPQKKKGWLD